MITHDRCVIAHRQGVFWRISRENNKVCKTAPMSGFDMEAFREKLSALMDERGIKRKPLAKAAGLGETSIRDIFDTKRSDIRVGTLVKLADFFDTTVDELIETDPVVLAGKIGAGGEVLFNHDDDHEPQTVSRPPGVAGTIMALQVVGTSMLPKYEDGDMIYVRRDHQGVRREYVGQYCAVRTADGGTYLKLLTKGSEPGRFTLRSLNAADMENVEIVWASPVEWVKQGNRTGE